jgi:hypothetical protein
MTFIPSTVYGGGLLIRCSYDNNNNNNNNNNNDRIAETLYSLGTWFVSGIYVYKYLA